MSAFPFSSVRLFPFALLAAGGVGLASLSAAAAEPLRFNRDIRPILSDKCFACHGPDQAKREAGLRLDVREAALAPLKSGATAIVPGDPEKSELVQRIRSTFADEQMPPPESGHRLAPGQIETLRRWVAEGAAYERHWAFEPVRAAPAGDGTIDEYIGRGLRRAGLTPSAPAAPATQLRRVTLDLTGLPPTREETDAFLADTVARGIDAAYAAAVDRLQQSPRYGERMAWPWLEAARYADTDGYQNDGPREMWRWRDWVIEAFNANMPFDRFTIEQLAGDLLPQPTHEQLIATGFNRNNRYNSEEGIPIDEFLLENAVDRVDTTSTVWMGLTMSCARCHDHKYDPISQKEYYQLVDYFNDVAESGRATRPGNSEPWIKTPTPPQREKLAALEAKVAAADAALRRAEPGIQAAQTAWERAAAPPGPAVTEGLEHRYAFDETEERAAAKGDGARLEPGVQGGAAVVNADGHFALGEVSGLIGNGRFSVAFWMRADRVDGGAVLSNELDGTTRSGILVEMVDGRLRWNINTRWISGVQTIETRRALAPGEWVHVTLTNDGTRRAAGMTIYLDGVAQPADTVRNTNSNVANRRQNTPMRVGFSRHVGPWAGRIDELRFYPTRTLPPAEAALLAVRETPAEIARMSAETRTPAQAALLRLAYLEQSTVAEHRALLAARRKAEQARLAYDDGLPTTMIMRDLPEGRPSFVRLRGVYDALGERVQPGVPAALPPLPAGVKNDRLAFARWLTDPEHPLTARVTVNRIWQLFFGRGFVDTPEDFGAQGSLPTHPELLDALAAGFVAGGWDLKALVRRIVLSAAYRQSSVQTEAHRRLDPDNRWLARAPRLRLPGNVLRDQALFVSGLLREQPGGPSVFPYQPEGLWEEASNARYTVGKGADLYRRSLYTYWKRTLAPPSLALLDAGDREYCTVKPKQTNTPLQALALLNETIFFEAARHLAERLLREGGATDEARIDFAFRLVTMRAPDPAERALLVAALAEYRREFAADPAAAAASLKVGASAADAALPPVELAAAAALANVLLNLDEVTVRE